MAKIRHNIERAARILGKTLKAAKTKAVWVTLTAMRTDSPRSTSPPMLGDPACARAEKDNSSTAERGVGASESEPNRHHDLVQDSQGNARDKLNATDARPYSHSPPSLAVSSTSPGGSGDLDEVPLMTEPLSLNPFFDLLSNRTRNCLSQADISTLADLSEWDRGALLSLKGFGVRCMSEVDGFLEANDLLPVFSESPATYTTVRGGNYSRLSTRTTDLLRQVNISTAKDLQVKSIRELLEVPGMDAEALDEIVTQYPPTVRDEQELLLLLATSGLVRTRFERLAAPAIDNALDTLVRCQDKVARQVELGLLHERALMDWGVVQSLNRDLRPPARTLPDLLFRQQYELGRQVVGTVGKLNEALDTPTIEEEMTLLMGRLDDRDAEIVRGRFSVGGRLTLEELGQRFEVSRERIRQREKQAAEELSNGYYWGAPLPRIRTAMLLIRQSQAVTPDDIYNLLRQRGLVVSESAVRDLLAVWRAIAPSESAISDSLTMWRVINPADYAFPEDILLYAKTGLTSRQDVLSEDVVRIARRLVRQVGAVTPAQIVDSLPDREAPMEEDVIAVLRQTGFRQIVSRYWSGGVGTYNVPRAVVDKMLGICGPLSLRQIRRGLLRHQRRQGYPVAPAAVLRAVLKQYEEFKVGEDDIVRLKETNVRPKLGEWERVWLGLVKQKGPVVHTDT